jgi:hypothetical protein
MKQIITLLILFTTLNTYAITIEVFGKSGEVLFSTHLNYALPFNVGEISVIAFDQKKIPYQGDSSGITGIFNLGSDIEIISDTELKAFGWCFSIDGDIVDTMPNQTDVLSEDSIIQWYYAYAHYKNGDWIGQCLRAQDPI